MSSNRVAYRRYRNANPVANLITPIAYLRYKLNRQTYGLSRDELRYILDPADVKGSEYSSETFRVLKTNEIRRFSEYRTARLVLQALDCLERGDLAA
jgi:hypothetical protein